MKCINNVILKSLNPEWLSKVELTLCGYKFNEKKNLVQLQVAITKDSNKYETEGATNMFEKFSINTPSVKQEQMASLKIGKKVKLEKIESVITYGDYQNNLSITGSVQFYD